MVFSIIRRSIIAYTHYIHPHYKKHFNQTQTFQLTRSGDLVSQVMLAFDVERVRAVADTANLNKIRYTGGPAPTATQSRIHPHFELVDGEYVYKKKLFVDDLGRAMIDRVTLSIGGYDIEDLTGKQKYTFESVMQSF